MLQTDLNPFFICICQDQIRVVVPDKEKVLTENLRSMESDGIIIRTVYQEIPPKVEYALSELGESMRPIIKSLELWGTNYLHDKGVSL